MFLPLIGFIIWVVKVQGALNRLLGEQGRHGVATGFGVRRPGRRPHARHT